MPAGGGSFGDPGGGRLAAVLQPGAGGAAGAVLRIPPASAAPAHPAGRRAVSPGHGLGLDLSGLRHLPGGSPNGVQSGAAGGADSLGGQRREAGAAGIFPVLEGNGQNLEAVFPSNEKFLENFKKSICIWGKMGYNKMESPWEESAIPGGQG